MKITDIIKNPLFWCGVCFLPTALISFFEKGDYASNWAIGTGIFWIVATIYIFFIHPLIFRKR